MRCIFTLCCLILFILIAAGSAAQVTFEVVLQGFEDNPEARYISYVRMYVNFDGSPVDFTAAGTAGACSGWWEATESGHWNGPSIFMAAFDNYGVQNRIYPEYRLKNGRMFWVEAASSVASVSAIEFWNADSIGVQGMNLYPGTVTLVEMNSSRAVFAIASTPTESFTWSKIKALYR